jgi:hypothetical protein
MKMRVAMGWGFLLLTAGGATAGSRPVPGEEPTRWGTICEVAFDRPLEPGRVFGPALVVLKKEPGWTEDARLGESPDEPRSLFCVKEKYERNSALVYTDGTAAYDLTWDLRIVSLPEGRVLRTERFERSAPGTKSGSGPGYARRPTDSELLGWLDLVGEPTGKDPFLGSVEGHANSLPSPAGDTFVVFRAGGAHLIDLTTQTEVRRFGCKHGFSGAFSPDGKLLATRCDRILVWDVASGKKLREIRGKGLFVRFLSGGKLFAAGPYNASSLWDVSTGRPAAGPQGLVGQRGIHDPQVSGDGRRLAWLTGDGNTSVAVWDLDADRPLTTLGPLDWAKDIALSPDGGLVAAVDNRGLTLWDVVSAQPRVLESFEARPEWHQVAISPDGRLVAAGNDSGTLALAELETGRLLGSTKVHPGKPWGLSFAANGATLIWAGLEETRLFDVAALQAHP